MTTSRPQGAAALRRDLADWLTSRGPTYYTSMIQFGKQPVRPAGPTHIVGPLLAAQEHQRITHADLWHLDHDLCDLLQAAHASMPRFAPQPHDLPSRTGFVTFAQPIVHRDPATEEDLPAFMDAMETPKSIRDTIATSPVEITAGSWGPCGYQTPGAPAGALWITFYSRLRLSDSADPVARRAAALLPAVMPDNEAVIRSGNLSDCCSCFAGPCHGEPWSYRSSTGVLCLPGTSRRHRTHATRASRFRDAFTSRSCSTPHMHTQVRSDNAKPWCTAPQAEQVFDDGIHRSATTNTDPYHTVLYSSWRRKTRSGRDLGICRVFAGRSRGGKSAPVVRVFHKAPDVPDGSVRVSNLITSQVPGLFELTQPGAHRVAAVLALGHELGDGQLVSDLVGLDGCEQSLGLVAQRLGPQPAVRDDREVVGTGRRALGQHAASPTDMNRSIVLPGLRSTAAAWVPCM